LDALAALGIMIKTDEQYRLKAELAPLLTDSSPHSVAPMIRHQANCLRRWARLPWVVRSGGPAETGTSIRGAEADNASFIEAMDVVSRAVADTLVAQVAPEQFRCVLDVGGASGTWTAAWLKTNPQARALLFDLPSVIPLAERHLQDLGLEDRVELVAGDYRHDELPTGADVAWVSAIVHQNSRQENRAMFQRIARALPTGGHVLIRDIVMDPSRTAPVAGSLFAVNMLVGTEGGTSYTLAEMREDLEPAGLTDVRLLRHHEAMHSIVQARKGHG
jgi:precorrin-6B methylase 2